MSNYWNGPAQPTVEEQNALIIKNHEMVEDTKRKIAAKESFDKLPLEKKMAHWNKQFNEMITADNAAKAEAQAQQEAAKEKALADARAKREAFAKKQAELKELSAGCRSLYRW